MREDKKMWEEEKTMWADHKMSEDVSRCENVLEDMKM